MRTELEKMLAGELYDPMDPKLARARQRARDLCWELNATLEAEAEKRRKIFLELFGQGGDSVWMQPPFYCDYGSNIFLGERVYFNFNCVVLDVCRVSIGDFTLIGPAVQIYTGWIYEGPGLVKRINRGLLQLLQRDGFKRITDAIGADVKK